MPLSSKPPRFTETLSRAHKDAQELIGRAIVEASGKNFSDLPKPPPLKFVVKAYCAMMEFHLTAAAQAGRGAEAEQEANRRGGHAAEILSPEGDVVGYTLYTEAEKSLTL